MICPSCGQNCSDDVKFCPSCGSVLPQNEPVYNQPPVSPYGSQPYNTTPPTKNDPAKGLAIASMICGIVSFLCFAIVCGTLGIVFGAIAKNKGSKSGMATAGIVCGAIGLGLWLITLIACGGMSFIPGLY